MLMVSGQVLRMDLFVMFVLEHIQAVGKMILTTGKKFDSDLIIIFFQTDDTI